MPRQYLYKLPVATQSHEGCNWCTVRLEIDPVAQSIERWNVILFELCLDSRFTNYLKLKMEKGARTLSHTTAADVQFDLRESL